MHKLFTFIIASLLTISQVLSQTNNNYQVQTYSTDNGMPSNGIKGIQWDEKNGFLWIATEAGVTRFNGLNFKSFTRENTSFIESERMNFLTLNRVGKILAMDQAENVFAVEKSSLTLLKSKPIDAKPNYDYTYTLSVSDLLYEKKVKEKKGLSFSLLFDKIIPVTDSSCLAIKASQLYFISLNTERKIELQATKVQSGFKINEDIFIVDDQKNIFHFETGTEKLALVSISKEAASLWSNNSPVFWTNGMQNPVLISRQAAWSLTYNNEEINTSYISGNIPTGVLLKYVQYSKKRNILFIGTDSKGIIIIKTNLVTPVKNKTKGLIERNAYYSQIELGNGNILTNEGHILGNSTTPTAEIPIKGKFSVTVNMTRDSILWYGQFIEMIPRLHCLHSYNYKTGLTKIYPKVPVNQLVIVRQVNNDFYVTTPSGIGRLSGDTLIYLHKFGVINDQTFIYDFKEIEPGVFGVATCFGLLRFHIKTNQVDTLFKKENYCVRTLWKYKDYLFFGTYGKGFYIYKNGSLKAMPLDKNNYLLYTHCFFKDEQDYLWMSTNRGLFKGRLADIINAFEKNTAQVYYHYFGKNDGMDITEMNGGCAPCALLLKNKNISFPTMDGLLEVNPATAMPSLPDGDIYIDDIIYDNRNWKPDSSAAIKFPASVKEIIINIGLSVWCNKENIYLEYRLNNNEAWQAVNIKDGTEIKLNNLPQGSYELQIRKLNGFGENNYTNKTIAFTIATPWYKQWWFYLLIALSVLGLFILIYRVRITQLKRSQQKLEKQVAEKTLALQQTNEVLEKNNSINTRLISIISHDIITPLKFLNVAGKNLLEKKNIMPEELKDETIQEITNTSKELQLLSTNILNWIKYQNENRRLAKEEFNMHDMVKQIFSILNSMAHQKKLNLVNQVNPEINVTQYFEPLKILIYNLITNAIHFSEKGNIIIDTILTNDKIIVTVQDEGTGMTPEQVKNIMADQFIISSANVDNKKGNGLGYLIIKDLLKMTNAKLSIESEKGKGTKVFVELPKQEMQ